MLCTNISLTETKFGKNQSFSLLSMHRPGLNLWFPGDEKFQVVSTHWVLSLLNATKFVKAKQ